jgi:hypothetical protein
MYSPPATSGKAPGREMGGDTLPYPVSPQGRGHRGEPLNSSWRDFGVGVAIAGHEIRAHIEAPAGRGG